VDLDAGEGRVVGKDILQDLPGLAAKVGAGEKNPRTLVLWARAPNMAT
jgi:hypothetical protein